MEPKSASVRGAELKVRANIDFVKANINMSVPVIKCSIYYDHFFKTNLGWPRDF